MQKLEKISQVLVFLKIGQFLLLIHKGILLKKTHTWLNDPIFLHGNPLGQGARRCPVKVLAQ